MEKTLQTRSPNTMDCRPLVNVGLSILSWRGAKTLNSSLESYNRANLFSIFKEAQVFLPDPDETVMAVAEHFDVQVRTISKNLGIMENMAAAAEAMTTDYILMLENDCPLIHGHSEAQSQIIQSLELLRRDDVIMARLRSVSSPGQAFDGLAKYQRLYDGSMRSRLTRTFRPEKIKRLSGYALYDSTESIQRHGDYFEKLENEFYVVDAAIMPWTNQSILIERATFLNEILPLARSVKTRRHANDFPNLEIELNNSHAWRNSGWKIACGPGLFTHERIGNRGYV